MKKKVVLEAGKYLTEYSGDVWDFKKGLPTGIIDKKYTGLGATYCEIYAKRSSIIVSPTRSLARSKYENAVEDKNQNNINKDYSFFYLGGGFEEFNPELFADFLINKNQKKIFVVSDSFYKILKFGGKKIYNEFALVVDEIDSIQQDTSYRSCLEDVVDYFWKFKNKAVVTATFIDFTDERFLPSQDFPYYEVEIIDYKKPELNFFEVSAPLIGTINLIHELFLKDNNKKMFIALNCVSDINKIIKTLKENENFEIEDFGVFCSEKSETKIYPNVQKGELVKGILNKKINFATSSYFVGIDIEEPVHLIVCNSDKKPYTVIFPEKILQILGRCRSKAYSFNIITFEKLKNKYVKDNFPKINKDDLISRIGPIKGTLNRLSENSDELHPEDRETFQNLFIGSELGGSKNLFRIDNKKQVVISHFTVDYLTYNSKRAREYEYGNQFLRTYLKKYFTLNDKILDITTFEEINSLSSSEKVEMYLGNYKKKISKIAKNFPGHNLALLLLEEAEMNKDYPTTATLILQTIYFKYLYGYDAVDNKIREYNNDRIQSAAFGRVLKLLKLTKSNFFKEVIKSKFKINTDYTYEEMSSVFLGLVSSNKMKTKEHILDFIPVDSFRNKKLSVEVYNHLFHLEVKRKGRKKVTIYKIISFDSEKFKSKQKMVGLSGHQKLEQVFGIDDMSILQNVSKELLDSIVK